MMMDNEFRSTSSYRSGCGHVRTAKIGDEIPGLFEREACAVLVAEDKDFRLHQEESELIPLLWDEGTQPRNLGLERGC
jgi:hypothetical protein